MLRLSSESPSQIIFSYRPEKTGKSVLQQRERVCVCRFVAELPAAENKPKVTRNVEVTFEGANENEGRVKLNGKTISVSGNMNLAQPTIQLKVRLVYDSGSPDSEANVKYEGEHL